MSSGPDNVTQTTRTDPSPYLVPGIQATAAEAGNMFAGGNPLANLGQTALANRGLQGSPVTGAAQDLTTQTLQGDFLNSNPYLDQTLNRAADLTRTRLSSEFAGAGRDIGASLPARSEELQTLASNIYGQNYQAERGRQMQAAQQAIPLANQDFTDINALIDAANLPLDQFINRIGALAPAAGGTAVSTQPLTRNTAGGVLGGASSGFALGSSLFPGAGGIIGAGLGGLAGLLG